MDIEVKDKANRRHVGHNLQKIRVYFGMKHAVFNSIFSRIFLMCHLKD